MPLRPEPFMNNCIYHVFNKTIDKRRIFKDDENCLHFYERLAYYRSNKATISFSRLSRFEERELEGFLKRVSMLKYLKVKILAYCFIRTHFHFLLKQLTERGVPIFLSDLLNSFTRNFNIRSERNGPIFLPKFKSVRVKTDEQLMHVSRYIHLHPYSNSLISELDDLENYRWSSYRTYLGKSQDPAVETRTLLSLFRFKKNNYRNFVESNANHQKTLENVKHLKKW